MKFFSQNYFQDLRTRYLKNETDIWLTSILVYMFGLCLGELLQFSNFLKYFVS